MQKRPDLRGVFVLKGLDTHVRQALHNAAQGASQGGVARLKLLGHQIDAINQGWIFFDISIAALFQQPGFQAGCQRLQGFSFLNGQL